MILGGKSEAIHMALQIGKVDEVVRLGDTGGQIVGITADLFRPDDRHVPVGLGVVGSRDVPVAEPHALQRGLATQLPQVVRDDPPSVIDRDVAGGHTRLGHQGDQQGAQQHRVSIALPGVAAGIVVIGPGAVHVDLDGDSLPAPIAALSAVGCVVGAEKGVPGQRGDAVVNHALHDRPVKVFRFPPVALAVPVHAVRVVGPDHPARLRPHACPVGGVPRKYRRAGFRRTCGQTLRPYWRGGACACALPAGRQGGQKGGRRKK